MPIVIDGYNLIFADAKREGIRGITDCEASRERLLNLLARYKTIKQVDITVVFDGGIVGRMFSRWQSAYGIKIIFSKPESDADTEVKKFIAHYPEPTNLRVVTSDNEIKRFAERFQATVVSSKNFLEEIDAILAESEDMGIPTDEPLDKYEGLTKGEVDYWLRAFGYENEGTDEG